MDRLDLQTDFQPQNIRYLGEHAQRRVRGAVLKIGQTAQRNTSHLSQVALTQAELLASGLNQLADLGGGHGNSTIKVALECAYHNKLLVKIKIIDDKCIIMRFPSISTGMPINFNY